MAFAGLKRQDNGQRGSRRHRQSLRAGVATAISGFPSPRYWIGFTPLVMQDFLALETCRLDNGINDPLRQEILSVQKFQSVPDEQRATA